MITVKHKGNFNRFEQFCNRALRRDYLNILSGRAEQALQELKAATPVDDGETAAAWGYRIESGDGLTRVIFTNSHEENGMNIAILLIYGHGTRNGGYVQGNDFVTPIIEKTFKDLAYTMWKEVTE